MRRRLLWIVVGLAAVPIAWLGLAVSMHAVHAGEILPGTRVAGVQVGGLSPEEARERLAPALRGKKATLAHGDQRFTVRAEEIGYGVDLRATVTHAMEAGRGNPLTSLLWQQIASLWGDREVPPATSVDRERLGEAIRTIAGQVQRPGFRGDLSIDADSLRVEIEPPRPARTVDEDAAATATLAALRRRDPGTVALPVRSERLSSAEQVRTVAEAARTQLEKPLELSGNDSSVEIAPQQLAPLLTVVPAKDQNGRDIRLGVREDELSDLVDSLAEDVDQDATDAEVSAPTRPVTVDTKTDLSWEPRSAEVDAEPGERGQTLNQQQTAKAITAAVRAGEHSGKLPIEVEKPDVPTSAARQMDSLIGTFTTHFSCCEPRVTNIQQMARTVDGTLVMPGEEFSLNGVVGERTKAKGYVPAPYILRGELVPDVGGGVSQFSTTMYNAAFFAGLPVTDHQPHSYYISRYPPGRESTLNYPTIDLTWTNDTGTPILVRALAGDTSVSVSLYGNNGGRTVQGSTGPRKPWAKGDFKITINRTVTYPDDRVERSANTVHYDEPPQDEENDENEKDGGDGENAND